MATSYTKLRDGSWGIRSTDQIKAGDTVTVTTKAGITKRERIGKIIWTGQGVTLASIDTGAGAATNTSRRRGRGARYCEGWGADNPHEPRPPYTCEECGWDE